MKSNKELKIFTISIIIIYTILSLIISINFNIKLAKYIASDSGSMGLQTAEIICTMEVNEKEDDSNYKNSYCDVVIRDYKTENGNTSITETDVNYRVEVSSVDGTELPDYYWYDSDGNEIAKSSDLTGTFTNAVKEEKTYKIMFVNSGESEITKKINFKLVAVQAQ